MRLCITDSFFLIYSNFNFYNVFVQYTLYTIVFQLKLHLDIPANTLQRELNQTKDISDYRNVDIRERNVIKKHIIII